MKNCVLINCDDKYVPKAIVALKQFTSKNPTYQMEILGTSFNSISKKICEIYNVHINEVNLANDFINLDKRPYGKQYPIECFYHFYAYKILCDYDFIVLIEPDIYTNKVLDIDLSLIEYIGGSYSPTNKISVFGAIANDYQKIKNVYNWADMNQYRILGGVKIYNVKNLSKIKFYEKIVEYYKKSWSISAPRCGDDSLMCMYQMLHKNHIKLLGPEFHVLGSQASTQLSEEYINKIYFIHFEGSTDKYWNFKNTKNNTVRYFFDKTISYIYNNFSIDFIREHIPSIYRDINKTHIAFYYYNGENNFGDLITPYFLNKFCNKADYGFNFANDSETKIISCGSIMRLCNKNTIVYGSGIRDIDQKIEGGIIKIVRGPLTRKRLLEIGCYCPPTYGDPGLLLPTYYNPIIKKRYALGIVPHHIHYVKIRELYVKRPNTLIINLLNTNIESVINDMLSCEKIISSSLHGLIISDAYNIPNKWIQFDDKITGDNTKFYDYFQSVNRIDTSFIDCLNFKKIPENVFDIIEKVSITVNIDELKENMFFDKSGIKNYTKYLVEEIKNR